MAVDYNVLRNYGTGSHSDSKETKIVSYPFGRYNIKIELTSANEFLGVVEVGIDKEFIAHKRAMIPKGYHDVEEFYPDYK